MIDKDRIIVIVPAYNEEDAIVSTVQELEHYGWNYVVINDGSTDATAEICKQNNINVVNLPNNLGIGGAVQTGHKYALDNNYLVDIQFDGDGQHDAKYIPSLLSALEDNEADLVIGSRFIEKTDGFQSTFLRRVGISWIHILIKLLTKTTVTDPTSGFRACSLSAIKYYTQNYPADYPEPESIVALIKRGSSVSEVSVQMRERQGGKSSIFGFKSIYYMIKVTLAMLIASATTSDSRG